MPAAVGGRPAHAMKASVGPLTTCAADDRRHGDDRRGAARSASAMPGHREDRADRDTGFDGPMTIGARAGDRVEHRLGRARRLDALELDAVDGPLAALADHELLEGAPSARGRGRAVRTGCVGHRQHAGAARRAPRASSASASVSVRALGQALPRAAGRREVAVAEVEPHVDAQLAQPVHDVERVVAQAPAALVDAVGEPERAQVRVGGDVGAVDLDVVGRVGDDDEVVADDVEHAAGELGAAGAAGEDDDRAGHQILR